MFHYPVNDVVTMSEVSTDVKLQGLLDHLARGLFQSQKSF
jgi:hypothetical protein